MILWTKEKESYIAVEQAPTENQDANGRAMSCYFASNFMFILVCFFLFELVFKAGLRTMGRGQTLKQGLASQCRGSFLKLN